MTATLLLNFNAYVSLQGNWGLGTNKASVYSLHIPLHPVCVYVVLGISKSCQLFSASIWNQLCDSGLARPHKLAGKSSLSLLYEGRSAGCAKGTSVMLAVNSESLSL